MGPMKDGWWRVVAGDGHGGALGRQWGVQPCVSTTVQGMKKHGGSRNGKDGGPVEQ